MLVSHFVTRAQWGAAPPRHAPTPLPLSAVRRVFQHYSASSADEQADHRNCATRVRGIQRFHQSPSPTDPTKPWNDIAYSFLVCKHGFVFEGRGFGVRTAATGPCNDDSYAICFLGDDTDNRDDVTDLGRDAIAEIFAECEVRKGSRLSRFGHRDCMQTSCPGDQLYRWFKSAAARSLIEAQKAPVPKFEWYIAAGGKIVIRAGSLERLGHALEDDATRLKVRDAIIATTTDRGGIGRRRIP